MGSFARFLILVPVDGGFTLLLFISSGVPVLFALLLGLFLAPLWHGFGSWLLLDSWRGEPILVSFYSLVGYFLAVPHVRGPVTYSLFWIGPVAMLCIPWCSPAWVGLSLWLPP